MRGHGLRDGAALLELGCGPGWSTLKFAQALPQARLTCVEVDEGMVRRPHALAPCSPIGPRPRARPHPRARPALAPPQVRAARALLAGHERVTVRHGLAQRTGLPCASFDFVTMRFLLQHLRRPSLVLREAMRLLRPGGGVAVVETDDLVGGVMDPLVPSLQPLNLKFSARQAQQGGSRFVGRHLLRMLHAAGFAERHVEAALAASDEFDEGVAVFAPHFDVTRFRVLVDEGQISAAEYDEAEAAIRAFLEEPASIAMMVNMVAHSPLAPLGPLAPLAPLALPLHPSNPSLPPHLPLTLHCDAPPDPTSLRGAPQTRYNMPHVTCHAHVHVHAHAHAHVHVTHACLTLTLTLTLILSLSLSLSLSLPLSLSLSLTLRAPCTVHRAPPGGARLQAARRGAACPQAAPARPERLARRPRSRLPIAALRAASTRAMAAAHSVSRGRARAGISRRRPLLTGSRLRGPARSYF